MNNRPVTNNKEVVKYAGMILTFLLLGVFLLFIGMGSYTGILGGGILAYTLGLRHAFDADHIAAIDNITRKFINQGKKNKGVGFFFSLGHSTVVILMSGAVVFAVEQTKNAMPALQSVGGVVATLISGAFLLALAVINSVILKRSIDAFMKIKRGDCEPEDAAPQDSNFIAKLIDKIFNIVDNYGQIYIIGLLFGLGFDTATQIALIATSASATNFGIPWYVILSFPILFTAGMTMMDTADGFIMSSAYNWAFSSPVKRIWFNITLTGLSVLFAGVVGIVEIVQVISQQISV